jgi:uncharacterized protein with GYD domain
MPKYLLRCRYTADGWRGLKEDGGTRRKERLVESVNSLGGELEALYFALGEDDAFIVVDAPDNSSVAAAAIAVAATGAAHIRTTALLTPEEVDEAVKRKVNYRPPGR